MFNKSIAGLAISSILSQSPFISFSSTDILCKFTLSKSNFNRFSNSFLRVDANKLKLTIERSSFSYFLNTSIAYIKTESIIGKIFSGNSSSPIEASTDIDVSRCTFKNNFAIFSGGAIMAAGNQIKLNVDDSIFTNNTATTGGAIIMSSLEGFMFIRFCTFNNNSANDGGALFVSTETGIFESSLVVGSVGSPIYFLVINSQFNISYSSFVENNQSIIRFSGVTPIRFIHCCFQTYSGINCIINFTDGEAICEKCCINKKGFTGNKKIVTTEDVNDTNCSSCLSESPKPTAKVNIKFGKEAIVIIVILGFFIIIAIVGVISSSCRAKRASEKEEQLLTPVENDQHSDAGAEVNCPGAENI